MFCEACLGLRRDEDLIITLRIVIVSSEMLDVMLDVRVMIDDGFWCCAYVGFEQQSLVQGAWFILQSLR